MAFSLKDCAFGLSDTVDTVCAGPVSPRGYADMMKRNAGQRCPKNARHREKNHFFGEEVGGVHGHDERISTANLRLGTQLLLDTVRRAAGNP